MIQNPFPSIPGNMPVYGIPAAIVIQIQAIMHSIPVLIATITIRLIWITSIMEWVVMHTTAVHVLAAILQEQVSEVSIMLLPAFRLRVGMQM
jgi:hypothetical protein